MTTQILANCSVFPHVCDLKEVGSYRLTISLQDWGSLSQLTRAAAPRKRGQALLVDRDLL
jgi:hypothetical protein